MKVIATSIFSRRMRIMREGLTYEEAIEFVNKVKGTYKDATVVDESYEIKPAQ